MNKYRGKGDSTQNRFTAYLMAAIKNKRISYMDKKKQRKEREELWEQFPKGHTDFEEEYHKYLVDAQNWDYGSMPDREKLEQVLEERSLIRAFLNLKKREQEILIAHVFEEKGFDEIGARYGMTGKQAEMAYYYIIRKIRKVLEGKRYE